MRRCQFYSASEYPQRWPLWRGTHHRVAGGCTGPNHAGEPGLGMDHRTFGQTALGLRLKEKPGQLCRAWGSLCPDRGAAPRHGGAGARGRGGKIAARIPAPVLAPWGAGLVGRPGWGHPQRAAGAGQRLWRQPMARQPPRNGPRQRGRRSTRGAPCALGASPAGRGRLDPRATRRDRQLSTATAPAHTTAAVFGRAGCRLGSPAGPLLACGYRSALVGRSGPRPMPQHLLARRRALGGGGDAPQPTPGQRAFAGFAPPVVCAVCRPCCGGQRGTAGSGHRLAVSRR